MKSIPKIQKILGNIQLIVETNQIAMEGIHKFSGNNETPLRSPVNIIRNIIIIGNREARIAP